MKIIPRTVVSTVTSLALGLLLLGSAPALRGDPGLEPVPDINQETKTEIKFTLKAQSGQGARFSLAKLLKDGKPIALPVNMVLHPETGAFSWTPTPSQAGIYRLTLAVKDGAAEGTTTVQFTVRPRPIAAGGGAVGDLLRKWYAEGTAAGNTGDFYDNRDRDHSPLSLNPFPQLDMVTYTAEQRKQNFDWAWQRVLLPHVTFGNSSTSAGVLQGGSNVRSYYVIPRGADFLYSQYRQNNIYMYPGHHDHHPGHNGKPFYGDVYPANTPYLITSQGSSGTDQPFMRAVPYTLAAFRPEVKQKLKETGLLMPTVQMILRSTNKHLAGPREYLTPKAHPTVFEGSWVNDLKMVQLAHEIQLHDIPPMIQLKVVEEDTPIDGKDYFEGGRTETLFDTPAAIARIVRGGQYVRRMVVSAEGSFDINHQPLTYHWVVLRGDPARVKINPLNDVGSVVELLVPYHDRRPVDEAALKIESHRVDIGAFVHNGSYYSAPGFVTFCSLDHESRTYDEKGRLLEIGYGAGDADLNISDWNALFDVLKLDADTFATPLLKKSFTPDELTVILKAAEEYRAASAVLTAAQGQSKQANDERQRATVALKTATEKRAAAQRAHEQDPGEKTLIAWKGAHLEREAADNAHKAADAAYQAAQKAADSASKATTEVLAQKRLGLELPVKGLVERALDRIKENPAFVLEHREAIEELFRAADDGKKARVTGARKQLIGLGILKQQEGGELRLHSIREGNEPLAQRLTRYERNMLERYQADLLSALVYPKFLTVSFKVNFVDQRIFTPKAWRDVYHHDSAGNVIGWTRYHGDVATEFNADGLVVLEKDALGRATKARTVKYEVEAPPNQPANRTLKQTLANAIVHFEYDGDRDRKGRITKRESVDGKP